MGMEGESRQRTRLEQGGGALGDARAAVQGGAKLHGGAPELHGCRI